MAAISTVIYEAISTAVYGEEISTSMCGAALIQIDDRKAIGELQSKVWNPGIMQEIKAVEYEQQHEEIKDQLQNKV